MRRWASRIPSKKSKLAFQTKRQQSTHDIPAISFGTLRRGVLCLPLFLLMLASLHMLYGLQFFEYFCVVLTSVTGTSANSVAKFGPSVLQHGYE